MKKVAIVIPYFGSWPEWFYIFLETCKYNEEIDWMFFTNCSIPSERPKNTHFEEMNLKDFENLASKKTGIKAKIKRPYKVCDFRPAFGKIFHEYLKGYDFWGWGDVDVIYGNLKNIFSKSNLQKYDVISVRRRRTAGALTVLRNEEKLNTIYEKSPDLEKVLGSSEGYAFDESGSFRDRNVFSITDAINKHKNRLKINTLFWDYTETDKKMEIENEDIYWRKGKMHKIKTGEEVYMYHFIETKKKDEFDVQNDMDVSSGLLIGREGICEANSPPSIRWKPLFLTGKRMKDGLRWMKDRIEQKWA